MNHEYAFTVALAAARKFFCLAETAAKHGGFWVSTAGGTANVVAGEISRATDVSFTDAYRALSMAGTRHSEACGDGGDWYAHLYYIQRGWDMEDVRWDARLIARAAIRSLQSVEEMPESPLGENGVAVLLIDDGEGIVNLTNLSDAHLIEVAESLLSLSTYKLQHRSRQLVNGEIVARGIDYSMYSSKYDEVA